MSKDKESEFYTEKAFTELLAYSNCNDTIRFSEAGDSVRCGKRVFPLRIQLAPQFGGTLTYERSNAAIEAHPNSRSVRSTSARRISRACATPASPEPASP
jgi:hypothetical protein